MNILKFNFRPKVFSINGKEHKIKPNYVDLILSFIINRMINNSDIQYGYVEIPSKSFKKLYDNYWVYISYLIEIGIIERKPYSMENHSCYGYRFCYDFIKYIQINEVILNDTCDRNTDYKEIPIEDQAIIDYKIIQQLKSDFLSAEIDTTNIDKVRIENTPYVDAKKYFYNLIQLFKWKEGSNHIYFEFKSNRLYSNFTFLSSHYREKNIKLKGEKVVEFDISSSFPLMLAVYCIRVKPIIINDYDFKEYCTSIKQKNFYQDLTILLNRTKDCDTRKESHDKNGNEIAKRIFAKDIVKSLFQIFLNGDNNRTPFIEGYSNSFIKEQFALKYPCVYEIIEEIKSTDQQIYYKLSKIESEFIFGIIEDLYNQFPELKILTVHDAIYVPQSYSKKVNEVWDKHLNKLFTSLPGKVSDNYEEYNDEDCFEEIFQMDEGDESMDTQQIQIQSNSKHLYGKYYIEDLEFDYDEFNNDIEEDDWI